MLLAHQSVLATQLGAFLQGLLSQLISQLISLAW